MTLVAVDGRRSNHALATVASPWDPSVPAAQRRAASLGRAASSLALLVGCLLAGPVRADTQVIEWHDGLLSVHAHNADRRTVLRDVAHLTQTQIDGLEHTTGPLDIDLTDVPLRSALQSLVGAFSYALTEFGRGDAGDAVHYAVRINGPRPLQPAEMPTAAPGWPGPAADGGAVARDRATDTAASRIPSMPPGMSTPPAADPAVHPARLRAGPPTNAPGQPVLPDPVR